MKTPIGVFAAALAAVAVLGGCVAVPVEPGPVVYAAPPPPAVVVQPYVSFGSYYGGYYGGYYGRRAPYWRRGWH